MNAQRKFWNWFLQHEATLFDFDPEQEAEREKLFDELAGAMQEVHPTLTFEFSPKSTTREFVISADGIKAAFPSVVSLTDAAPSLPGWQVTAFRPRRDPINIVSLGPKKVDTRDVQFSLLTDGKTAGLYLFIPGFQEGDIDWKQIGYPMLNEALGEFDVETKLGMIEMLSPGTSTEGIRHPLPELPALFDDLVVQLERRSGRLS